MRLHNFFIDQKIGDESLVVISDSDLIHQWRHVFRFNTGSTIVLFDDSGFEFTAQFMSLTYLKAELVIQEKRKNKFHPKKEIFLFQAIIKPDKFEWILEKGAELGVSHFLPVVANRSIARKLNLKRAQKIIKESAEQSGRGLLPKISEPLELSEVFSKDEIPFIAFDPSGSTFDYKDFETKPTLGILIGPEGGWNEQELELMREKKVSIVSLGTQILRAETAAIAVSALLLL